MTKMSNEKFATEKALHEIIRDLPNAKTWDACFRRGLMPLDEALNAIADEIRKERKKANA
jgi:hypothetical protein